MAQVFAGVNTTIGFLHVWNIVDSRPSPESGLLARRHRAYVRAPQNAGTHDGLQTSLTSKFVYGLWSVRDCNPACGRGYESGDRSPFTWTPLLATPPYPSWTLATPRASRPRRRAHFSSHSAATIFRFPSLGPRTMGLPSVTRDFTGFGSWPSSKPGAGSTAASTTNSTRRPVTRGDLRFLSSRTLDSCDHAR